ncbi:hypothetical protein NSP_34950 [Nodularia spumigena CCY9414]|nr:hypothetical protein NSP_34950 [Nodularia spumigena CCY9414]
MDFGWKNQNLKRFEATDLIHGTNLKSQIPNPKSQILDFEQLPSGMKSI